MSNYFRQSFKTLMTGNPLIDNYQVEGDTTIRTAVTGSLYDFDFVASRHSDVILQLEASGSRESVGNYNASAEFDITGINAMTAGQFVSFKVQTPSKTVDIRFGNYTTTPTFRDFYLVPRPSAITVVGSSGITASEVFCKTIVGILQKELPEYAVDYLPLGDGTVEITAIHPGGLYNATITAVDALGAPSSLVTIVSTDALIEAYDAQCVDVYGDFNIAIEVDADSNSYLTDIQTRYLATQVKGYNKSHKYVFNVKDILNKMLPVYNLLDQKDASSFSGGGTFLLNGQIEPVADVTLKVKMVSNELEYDEGIEIKLKVIDGKWSTLQDVIVFDYLHDKMLPIDNTQDESESIIRVYADISTPFDGNTYTLNYSTENDISFVIATSNTTSADETINFAQNIDGILSDLAVSYLNYMIDVYEANGEFGMRINSRQVKLSNTFGYVEFHLFTAIGNNDTTLINFDAVTGASGVDAANPYLRVYPQTGIIPNTQLEWPSTTEYRPRRLLNNYRTSPSNYFQDVYDYNDWSDNDKTRFNVLEEVDVYFDGASSYMSSAFASFFTLWPGITIDDTRDTVQTTLGISRALIETQEGYSYFVTVDPIQFEATFSVVGTPILDDENINRTPGICHFNISALVRTVSGVLNDVYYNEVGSLVPSKARSITLNFDALYVPPGLPQSRVPLTTAIKLNMIPVESTETVHEFVYKSSLGGFSSFSFVGDLVENISSEVTTSTREQETLDNTVYNNGDVTVNQFTAQYFSHFVNSRTVEENNTEATYSLTYRTSNKEEYRRLRDMVESERIYYRLTDKNNIGQYIWAEVQASFKYELTGTDYTLGIEFTFLNPSANTLKLNEAR